jgi:hypothetical protein
MLIGRSPRQMTVQNNRQRDPIGRPTESPYRHEPGEMAAQQLSIRVCLLIEIANSFQIHCAGAQR